MCVNEALKMGSFPNILKNANVRSINKKVHPFHRKTSEYVTTFIKNLSKSDIRVSQIIFKLFSMKFCVDSEKHILRSMIYLNH